MQTPSEKKYVDKLLNANDLESFHELSYKALIKTVNPIMMEGNYRNFFMVIEILMTKMIFFSELDSDLTTIEIIDKFLSSNNMLFSGKFETLMWENRKTGKKGLEFIFSEISNTNYILNVINLLKEKMVFHNYCKEKSINGNHEIINDLFDWIAGSKIPDHLIDDFMTELDNLLFDHHSFNNYLKSKKVKSHIIFNSFPAFKKRYPNSKYKPSFMN